MSLARRLALVALVAHLAAATAAAAESPAATGSPPAAPTAAPAASPDPAARLAELERQERSFLERHLPAPLLGHGPRGLRWWQWAGLPVALLLSLGLGWLLGWVTRALLLRLSARTTTPWDDWLIVRLARPMTLFWALMVASALRPVLALDGAFDEQVGRGIKAGFFLAIFWGGFRAIDVAFGALADGPAARTSSGLRGLLPLLRKVSKAVALAIGAVAILNELGFQVGSLLAGLGIGGLAVALAAQKTVENLIGSLTIGMDQPFRVGDQVQVDGLTGTVEQVGIRSTRLRTPERTLVTIPNGKLADQRIETLAARDRYRLAVTLSLVRSTSSAQLREVLRELEAALRSHPALGPEAPQASFVDVRDSGLAVEVVAWLRAADATEFAGLRGELLLRFLEIVERAGSALAFPTRTVHLASPPPGAPAPPRPGP